MSRRFAAILFRHLTTDWHIRRQPELRDTPFVLAAPEHGRMVIKAASEPAERLGIGPGMAVADSRALYPGLKVVDHAPENAAMLLNAIAEWCLRFTPVAAADPPGGLLLETSGCTHLWGGEHPYLKEVVARLCAFGYDVRASMADTIGTAWAVSRYGTFRPIIDSGAQAEALMPLPPAALRIEPEIAGRLEKLGLRRIGHFMHMPRAALRRRFGTSLLQQLDYALGHETEPLLPVKPVVPYTERLPCPEPIRTRTGIEIALQQLLEKLCRRLADEEKGLRTGILKACRMDDKVQQVSIGTNRPSRNAVHLFRLFDLKIGAFEPDLGFEMFLLEATAVEELSPMQEMLWNTEGTGDEAAVAELLDRLAGRIGISAIHRYLPDEHYWPERSCKPATSLTEQPQTGWQTERRRPVHLLPRPEPIEVMVRIPDYPPVHFIYRGKIYRIALADGPERIEPEWWIEPGQHRDYFCVEDEEGARYWIFRRGNYNDDNAGWFLHGFFA